jgi:glycosyltransferase involved in cell wall biosynthesis
VTADVTLVSPYPTCKPSPESGGNAPGRPGTAGGEGTDGGGSRSGVAWYTRSLAQSLTARGARVHVVAPGEAGSLRTEMDGAVQVDRCFERGPAGPLRAVGAAVATGAPVVHVQHEAFLYGGPDSVPGVLLALARLRQARRGPVVTMHQVVEPASVDRGFTEIHRVNIPPPVARAGLATMQSSVARIASRLIVHEEAFRRILNRSVVFPLGANSLGEPDPISGHPNDGTWGGDHASADPVASRRASRRAEAGVGPGDLLALCFGFVAPYKGFERVLEAARLTGPRVKVVVAGSEHPRLQGQGYLEQLRSRYSDVALFTGFVPDEDVAGWFAAADAVLLPYPQPFSSSGVLADAIEHGVAALVSAPLAEVIGWPPEASLSLEPSRMASRLDELAADQPQLEQLTAQTVALQAGRSWAELAERHLALYQEVIDAQRSPRRTVRRGSRR